jgi:xylulokinase
MIWQDRRATRETEVIQQKVPERRLYGSSGYRLSPHMTGPKLLWIKKNNPKPYAHAYRIVLPKDYVRSRFTGDYATDWTDANGTGLFDLRRKAWAYELIRDLGLDETKLPEIESPTQVAGEVSQTVSRKTGLDPGVPVIVGSGDDVVAIGAGGTQRNEVAINLGTSCSTYSRFDRPVLDPEMRLESFVDCEEGRWCLSGTTNAAAASVEWMIRTTRPHETVGNEGNIDLLDQLLIHDADPSGLVFLPYLMGERSPIWNPNATATLLGATFQHGRRDFIRAAIEGVCFSVRSILEIDERLTHRTIDSVRVVGSAAKSVVWMRTLANALGKGVLVPREEEATAIGASMLAAVSTGLVTNLHEASKRFVHTSRAFPPSPRKVLAFEGAFERFKQASRTM